VISIFSSKAIYYIHKANNCSLFYYSFLPAKQRALKTQKQFQGGHLKEDEFNPNLPNKNHAHWLKVRKLSSEGPPMRYKLN